MTAAWPVTLPLYNRKDQYNEKMDDWSARSDQPVGVPQLRPRSFFESFLLATGLVFSSDELEDFYDFYHNTIADGALPFTMTDPRVGGTKTFQLTEEPKVTAISSFHYAVTLNMRRLP